VQPHLHAIGFKQKDILQSSISATLPWYLGFLITPMSALT